MIDKEGTVLHLKRGEDASPYLTRELILFNIVHTKRVSTIRVGTYRVGTNRGCDELIVPALIVLPALLKMSDLVIV